MGKSTISMTIFNSYVSLPEGMYWIWDAEHGENYTYSYGHGYQL